MTRLDQGARGMNQVLVSRGTSNAAVARLLEVSEGAVRYHLGLMAAGAVDGRGAKPLKATRGRRRDRGLAGSPGRRRDQPCGACVAGSRTRL
jgi:hypothetical protein